MEGKKPLIPTHWLPRRLNPIPWDKRGFWIGLGLVSLLIRYLFSLNPYFTEVVYSRGLFPVLRTIWDYTLGWSPIPLLYLAVPLLLFLLYRAWKRSRKKVSWRHRMGRALLNLLALSGAILFLFFWAWGYNYQRQPVEHRLGLKVEKMDKEDLAAEFRIATAELIEAYEDLEDRDSSQTLESERLPEKLEPHMREVLEEVLEENDYPTPGRVRARRIYPRGTLIQFGASGIYIPLIGEGQVDAALIPASQPFVLAHELAHGYGFGDEGSCNYWAFQACSQSANAAVRYSGKLEYWIDVAQLYNRLDRESFTLARDQLPGGIRADLRAIREVYQKYPGFFPKVSEKVYDTYLQSQGIEEGIANYSRVVNLVVAWRKAKGESG
jgi:hypothetical protein